ncbi:MAG: glutamyl-tRNA reductase [Candidatus Omnitrophica bacterium]|nr:glutamyl-tRNA reductase [Candidatus Omnitrophota bacterium]
MGLFIYGLNYKECPIEVREKLHFSEEDLEKTLETAHKKNGFQEIMILSTCNRVEIYGVSAGEAFPEDACLGIFTQRHEIEPQGFLPFIYRYEGREVIHHLFRVAGGLDSMVIGENEILGQVRDAFLFARKKKAVGPWLHRLMEKALKVGKQIRTETKINQGAVSIPSVAVELARKIFGKIESENVMVLGTGEMSGLTLENLKASGARILYVVSRHESRGKQMAETFGAQWIPLGEWENYLGTVDILIASTSAPGPVVRCEQIERVMAKRNHRPLFLIDIGVPRNIEPHIQNIQDVYLYNIDDLKSLAASNLRSRREEIQSAEGLIDQAVSDYEIWAEQWKAKPVMQKIEWHLDDMLKRTLEQFPSTKPNPGEEEVLHKRILGRWMKNTRRKLKEAARTGKTKRYLEILHGLFGIEKEEPEKDSQEPL